MGEHVNKSFITRFLKKTPVDPAVELQDLKLQKQKLEEELKAQEKKKQFKEKQKYISEFYSAPRSKFTPVLKEADTLSQYLSKCFRDIPRKLNENLNASAPGSWIMQNTPQGIFYVNKDTGQWMNGLGVIANSLEELLNTTGEDLSDSSNSKPSSDDMFNLAEYPPLTAATSSLDYEVFATDWNIENLRTSYGYGTPAYTLHSLVPSVSIIATGYNGARTPSNSTGSDFDLNYLKTYLQNIPESRRVVNLEMWWPDLPPYDANRRDFYENTTDATTYLGSTFLTPWSDVEAADVKSSLTAVLNLCEAENIVIPYFTDNKGLETTGSLYSLQGVNSYYGGSFDASGNPITAVPSPTLVYGTWYPDARYFAAWINDARFNSYIMSTSGKSVAATMVDYYNVLSGNTLPVTAEQLYSRAAGITAFNDFTIYGLSYEKQFSYYGPGPALSEIQRLDEVNRSQAWMAVMDELTNGHYGVKNTVEAKNSVSSYANSLYSSYEIFPVGTDECEFYRDSNDQKVIKPIYNNLSGGNGWYGWHGNMIYPWSGFPNSTPPNYVSGYVLNPQTDEERYNWAGHNNPLYTPSVGSTLVRYASTPAADLTEWKKQVVYKQFVNDVKLLRHQHRSKPDFHLYHTPFLATNFSLTPAPPIPASLYSEYYDNSRYFREFVYHVLLHGVAYVMNYWAKKETMHEILDNWRTISYNSKSVPCSNSTGNVNLPVDRLVLSDAFTNGVMSGGRMTKTGKYLWRITAPPTAKREDNTIVFQNLESGFVSSELPSEVVVDCTKPENGYGFWIKRNVSTPPNYGVVFAAPEPA
jgi:hypothetical protein